MYCAKIFIVLIHAFSVWIIVFEYMSKYSFVCCIRTCCSCVIYNDDVSMIQHWGRRYCIVVCAYVYKMNYRWSAINVIKQNVLFVPVFYFLHVASLLAKKCSSSIPGLWHNSFYINGGSIPTADQCNSNSYDVGKIDLKNVK